MKILHVEPNHPLLVEGLKALGHENVLAYDAGYDAIKSSIHEYDAIIIRSRIPVDTQLLDRAINLKFIGRVGSGMENIDVEHAKTKGIYVAAAPEGNRNAVGEHALGLLLVLLNKIHTADREVRSGTWQREANRGEELDGKVVGIIGYGNTGKAFARKLTGFDVEVICYDILGGVGDEFARQVGIMEFQQLAEVVSLHVPLTSKTEKMINTEFINAFQQPIWFINTARGPCVVTEDLVRAIETGKILGAGLDVLEYEAISLQGLESGDSIPSALQYLSSSERVVLTPHVAGWTVQSKEKLAQTILEKFKARFH